MSHSPQLQVGAGNTAPKTGQASELGLEDAVGSNAFSQAALNVLVRLSPHPLAETSTGGDLSVAVTNYLSPNKDFSAIVIIIIHNHDAASMLESTNQCAGGQVIHLVSPTWSSQALEVLKAAQENERVVSPRKLGI